MNLTVCWSVCSNSFIISPVCLTPPSAITGISLPLKLLKYCELQITAISYASNYTRSNIEPGPIPTLIPSTPALAKNFAASPVAIFPATTSSEGNFDFNS